MADLKKQNLLLSYLISDADVFSLCVSVIDSKYFDPELRNSVSFILDYYTKYHTTPDTEQIEAETGIVCTSKNVTKDKIEYCATEIEMFCRRKAIECAILSSPDLIEKGDYGKVESLIKDAVTVSLNRDLGLDYFEDPGERLRQLIDTESPQSTGWSDFDALLNGGIVRKQLTLFSANSGGGKSIVMANLAVNMMEQGLNVLYLSLELSEAMVSLRFDSMITGMHTAEWKQRINETAEKVKQKKSELGNLRIKYMSTGSNSNDIRSYLKETELQNNFVPDVLVVDYLDGMGTNSQVSADNIFQKDKLASEELRGIANDYNLHLITASQQNRGAVDEPNLNHSHIAGGISKINTADVYVSIIMTDSMRAQGEMTLRFLKTRSSDGVGKSVNLNWNNKTLRITDNKSKANNLIMNKKSAVEVFTSDNGGGLKNLHDSLGR